MKVKTIHFQNIFCLQIQTLIFLLGAKLTTTNLTATIRDLAACEEYLIVVGLVGPLGLGPLTSPTTVITSFNKNAPPKGVTVDTDPKRENVMIVKWNSSCRVMNDTIGYEVYKYLKKKKFSFLF